MLYIKSNKSRAVIDLSGIWQFKLDDGTGFENNWMARPLEYADNLYVPAPIMTSRKNWHTGTIAAGHSTNAPLPSRKCW